MNSLVVIIKVAFDVMTWLIIARVLLSWFPHNPYNPVIRFIYEVTEPILSPFRRLLPSTPLPIDFSPIIAILVLQALEKLLISLILHLA